MLRALWKGLRSGLLLCALIVLPGTAAGQETSPPAVSSPVDTLQDWQSRLAEAHKHLEAGGYQPALDLVSPLIREMKNSIRMEPGMEPSLAKAIALRAVAYAGLERWEEASWDWSTARALDPQVTRDSLAPFGSAGKSLQEVVSAPSQRVRGIRTIDNDASPRDIKRPRKISGFAPDYPLSLKMKCQDGAVVLETILDEKGVPHEPKIIESPHPAFSLAALEAVQGWQFEPARFRSKAVKVYYTLTINFKMDDCPHQGP